MMVKRTALGLVLIFFLFVGPSYALWSISDSGNWPKSWPKELESVRKQSRSMTGSLVNRTVHEVPFTDREEFEAAWPHILKLKTQGAPIILVKSPSKFLGHSIKAGVRVFCPPGTKSQPAPPGKPVPGQGNPRSTWLNTNFIELVVDGTVVDLNAIPLPADTPIIDERFDKPK